MNADIKNKNIFRRIFSKIAAFVCALIIFFVVLFAIGAFIQADLQSQNILGNHDYQIFSYNRTGAGSAEFQAFGESFSIDLTRVRMLAERFGEVSAVNRDFTPYFIILSGNIIRGCVSSAAGSFGKIPEIIQYFVNNQTNQNDQNNSE